MNLKGKTVLVTGAAKRIGAEIARGFARRGACVLVHYHTSGKEARDLVRELRSCGTQSRSYCADLLSPSQILKMARLILKEGGGVDILVNNASLFFPTRFENIREQDWDDFLGIHIKAPFFLAQALAPGMKKRGGGRIIHIADLGGLRSYRSYLPYGVSKAAMLTLTEGLAKLLAPEISVTAVCPGPILPPRWREKEEREKIARKTLLRRWGHPEDVVKMVLFLAESDYITGSSHRVDGGSF